MSMSIFKKDLSGVSHFEASLDIRDVFSGVETALKSVPSTPSYFWWNGTFCPILKNDTSTTLLARWNEWRDAFQKDPKLLLRKMQLFASK